MIIRNIFFILLAYISGSLLFCQWLPLKWMNVNIVKSSNDGNPGTSNVFIHCGKLMGIACLILDVLKGAVPLYFLSNYFDVESIWFSFLILAPALGHAFSPWLHFKGGKCIAVTFGTLIGIFRFSNILFVLMFLYIFFSVVIVIRPHATRSTVSFILLSIFAFILIENIYIPFGISMIGTLIILKHYIKHEIKKPEIKFFSKPLIQRRNAPEEVRNNEP